MQTLATPLALARNFLLCTLLVLTLAHTANGSVVGPVIWGTKKYDARASNGLFSQIAVGNGHAIALRKDGTVVAWGDNTFGQSLVPTGLMDVTAVAAGYNHTVALTGRRMVVVWGANGQYTAPAGLSGVTAITAGAHHTVALQKDGTVVAWGGNQMGQTAVPKDLGNVTSIAAGAFHTIALTNQGTVVAWGANGDGQTTVPEGLSGVIAVAAGYYHSVALKSDGTVVTWGGNNFGQSTVPDGLSGVTAIAAGSHHTVALRHDGTVVAWGDDTHGQTTVPAGLPRITAITAGPLNTAAMLVDGSVAVWGSNQHSQAAKPSSVSQAVAVAGGDSHLIFLMSDGTVVPWGSDHVVPPGLGGVKAIAAGRSHSVALKNDGTVTAWGNNDYGQTDVPQGLSDVTAIAAGGQFTIALKRDGTVVAWGRNSSNQVTVPLDLVGVTAIAAGTEHAVAVKSDGTVVTWGDNRQGHSTVPQGLDGVVAVAAGSTHTVALKKDGTVKVWGSKEGGHTNVPSGLSGVIAIAASSFQTIALKSDGSVIIWGNTGTLQTKPPENLSGVRAIGTGTTFAAVLVSLTPVVTTGPATAVHEHGAALSGTVNISGYDTTAYFEYGPTPDYGASLAIILSSLRGPNVRPVSVVLSNLRPKTTYYYRVRATNRFGTSYGEQGTFTTPNSAPVTTEDKADVAGGRTISIDVLANDSDESGDMLTISSATPAQHGVVAIRNGTIFYTPDPDFAGEDTFTYTISDGFGGTATGTVTVTVPERPQNPVTSLLAAKGQPVLGAGVLGSGMVQLPANSTWASFGTPAINDAGQLAFSATIRAAQATHAGIFTYNAKDESYTLVAKAGTAVPAIRGAIFASLKDPVLDEAGRVAFAAKISGAGINKENNQAIFSNAYGDLQIIARTGDQAPGTPEGVKWSSFKSLALPDGIAGPLFVGKMVGNRRSEVTPANDLGLWGADSAGTVRLLLREGQQIGSRKLRNFVVLSSPTTLQAQTRSFNKAGEVIVRASFTDGSQGLVKVQVP